MCRVMPKNPPRNGLKHTSLWRVAEHPGEDAASFGTPPMVSC